jgi:hypothetical protein
VAVIELDLDAPPAPSTPRPPVHLLRPLGLALTALLVLALGGAAPVTPTLWRPLGTVSLNGDDSRLELRGDRLYVIDSPMNERRTVSAWSLVDGMRRIWTFPLPEAEGSADTAVLNRANLTPAGDVVLLEGESFTTSVLDAATGDVRWTAPGRLDPLGAGRGLIQESQFRPGTEYDQASGDPGELFWSSTGRPHVEPPLRTTMSGVDLRTGQRSWTADAPGQVFTAPIDGGAGLLVVGAEKLGVLDRDTGAVLRERAMPREPADIASLEVVGDLLLVRRGAEDRSGTVTAYDTGSLRPRWTIPDPPARRDDGGCVGLPCLRTPSELTVLDPDTGRPLWSTEGDAELTRRGGTVLETRHLAASRPMRVRDFATGSVRADLRSWNAAVATSDGGSPLLVSRIEPARQSIAFGALTPGAGAVQPLGDAGAILLECTSDERYVACRVPGGVQVWSYRA